MRHVNVAPVKESHAFGFEQFDLPVRAAEGKRARHLSVALDDAKRQAFS